jgi:hypothetical protein
MVVPLPGAGVNANAVQIYMGSQGGFWYVDKNGQNVDLTEPVHRLMAMQGQAAPQTMPVPQYAPPVQNVYNQQAPASNYGNPMGTAAAAGLGAMAGSAISNSNNNVPYGTPMYYHPNAAYAGNMQQQQQWYAQQQQAHPAQYQQWQQYSGQNPFVNQSSGYPNAASAANQYNNQQQQQQQANEQKAEQYHNTQMQQQQANQQKAAQDANQYKGNQQQQQQANQQKAEQAAKNNQGDEGGRHRFRRGGGESEQAAGAEQKAAEDGGKREGRFHRGGDDAAASKGAEASGDRAADDKREGGRRFRR